MKLEQIFSEIVPRSVPSTDNESYLIVEENTCTNDQYKKEYFDLPNSWYLELG